MRKLLIATNLKGNLHKITFISFFLQKDWTLQLDAIWGSVTMTGSHGFYV